MTVIKQAGVAAQEAQALGAAVENSGCVLAHECVPVLDGLVTRLQQALSAAVALQERAHGTPPPKLG